MQRHEVPLSVLAQDPDERYRPSPELHRLVSSVSAYLDRPLVPLLNAVIAAGMTTSASCADNGFGVLGRDRGVEKSLRAIAAAIPGAGLEWHIGGPWARWRGGAIGIKFQKPLDLARHDEALLLAASQVVYRHDPRECENMRWLESIARRLQAAQENGFGPGLTLSIPWPVRATQGSSDYSREVHLGQSGSMRTLKIASQVWWEALLEVRADTIPELQQLAAKQLDEMLALPAGAARLQEWESLDLLANRTKDVKIWRRQLPRLDAQYGTLPPEARYVMDDVRSRPLALRAAFEKTVLKNVTAVAKAEQNLGAMELRRLINTPSRTSYTRIVRAAGTRDIWIELFVELCNEMQRAGNSPQRALT